MQLFNLCIMYFKKEAGEFKASIYKDARVQVIEMYNDLVLYL